MLDTPVLFCVFNRPRLTERVFAEIRRAAPRKLLIIADGPRPTHTGDETLVRETREIVKRVDWDCEVLTNFSNVNLGCRQRMASGLNWAFDQCEQLIVLEDDCLPSAAFFDYCQAMLDRFKNEPTVGMICGDQFLPNLSCPTDAFFSKFPYVWGWASWKRAWVHYDLEMNNWPARRHTNWLSDWSCSDREMQYWDDIFNRQHAAEINTWDYSWIFNCWDQQMLSVHPRENLVSNIGFGEDATHTTDSSCWLANLPNVLNRPVASSWCVPSEIAVDPVIESRIFNEVYCPEPQTLPAKKSRWGAKLKRWFAA